MGTEKADVKRAVATPKRGNSTVLKKPITRCQLKMTKRRQLIQLYSKKVLRECCGGVGLTNTKVKDYCWSRLVINPATVGFLCPGNAVKMLWQMMSDGD